MIKKLSLSVLVFAIALFSIIFISASYAIVASAAEVEEAPFLYCTYYNSDGDEVNGNKLSAGTYDVNFVAKGFDKLSVAQVTAVFSEGATVNSIDSLLSDSTDLVSMGTVNSDGNLVFGFVPDTGVNYVSVDSDAVVLATVEVTFDQASNAHNYITISENPNLTFFTTDYSLGTDDEYALVGSFDGYDGQLTEMGHNVAPSFGDENHSISGSIVIMTNTAGATSGVPVTGTYAVAVYNDEERTQLLTTAYSAEKTVDGVRSNEFSIQNLEDGTYYLSISSDFAITRNDITITVNGDNVVCPAIPIIACNFNNNDQYITAPDAIQVYNKIGSDDMRYNINGDAYITAPDAIMVYNCIGETTYEPITIN